MHFKSIRTQIRTQFLECKILKETKNTKMLYWFKLFEIKLVSFKKKLFILQLAIVEIKSKKKRLAFLCVWPWNQTTSVGVHNVLSGWRFLLFFVWKCEFRQVYSLKSHALIAYRPNDQRKQQWKSIVTRCRCRHRSLGIIWVNLAQIE